MDGVKVTSHGFSTSALPFPIGHFSDQSRFSSASIDNMLQSIYSDPGSFTLENSGVPAGWNTAEEVWRDIPSDGTHRDAIEEPAKTLKDFLAKAGAFGTETVIVSRATGLQCVQSTSEVCSNEAGGFGMSGTGVVSGGASDGGTGRRSWAAVEELAAPHNKATQGKQRRMTKNRESAARSRERKRAYTMGLESLVRQLEEDNGRLLKEKAELEEKICKLLMEKVKPVTENRKAVSRMTRVHSMEW